MRRIYFSYSKSLYEFCKKCNITVKAQNQISAEFIQTINMTWQSKKIWTNYNLQLKMV